MASPNSNQPFTLYPKSWERATFQENICSSFCPSRPKEELCLEFIRDYITTNRPLTLNYNLIGTKIKLGSTEVSLSPFRTDVLFKGINKKFLHGATAYIPLTRILFSKKVAFKFEFGKFEFPFGFDCRCITPLSRKSDSDRIEDREL
jgi:hypothetical protein